MYEQNHTGHDDDSAQQNDPMTQLHDSPFRRLFSSRAGPRRELRYERTVTTAPSRAIGSPATHPITLIPSRTGRNSTAPTAMAAPTAINATPNQSAARIRIAG